MKTTVVFCALLALVSSAPKDVKRPTTIVDVDSSIPDFVFDIQDLPDGYADTRQEVKVVDGMLVEMNQTVSKSSDEGGAILAQFHIKVTPNKEGVPKAQLVLREDDGAKDDDPSDIVSRNRRGVFDWIKRSVSSPSGNFNNQPGGHFGVKSSAPVPTIERNDITYVGDTDVNYVGAIPRDNPDAEIFDAGLVRAEEERFLARRPQPIRSQPIRQPVWSQPIRSQPVHPQPVWAQPIRAHPVWSQPIRSQPIRSQPQVWYHHSVRSQPLRSQPVRAEPLISQPLRSHPVRKPLL